MRYALLAISLAASPALGFSTTSISTKPWCQAEIDYSAANEFIAAHYGRSKYFAKDRVTESIWNARQGVFGENDDTLEPARLTECGFMLLPLQEKPAVDWTDLNSIREQFLPEVREALVLEYGQDLISEIIFWCPTVRVQDARQTERDGSVQTPRSSYVATAHIDTDLNAYKSVEQFVNVVQKNRFPGTDFDQENLIKALQQGRRFAIVNAWCNIGYVPVQRAPLAFQSTRYAEPNTAFPNGVPIRSHWYTFPAMTPDELLLFCQYDRDAAYTSDLWHCALTRIDDGPPRNSFDVRCFILFKETVPEQRDRFIRRDKTSLLNYKESQTFCSEQAERRKLQGK